MTTRKYIAQLILNTIVGALVLASIVLTVRVLDDSVKCMAIGGTPLKAYKWPPVYCAR